MSRTALPDLADVTRAQVERAVRRRLLRFGLGQDAVDAVMSIVGPVIEAKDRRYVRLKEDTQRDSRPVIT